MWLYWLGIQRWFASRSIIACAGKFDRPNAATQHCERLLESEGKQFIDQQYSCLRKLDESRWHGRPQLQASECPRGGTSAVPRRL